MAAVRMQAAGWCDGVRWPCTPPGRARRSPALACRPAGVAGRAALVQMRSTEMKAPEAAVPATSACSRLASLLSRPRRGNAAGACTHRAPPAALSRDTLQMT